MHFLFDITCIIPAKGLSTRLPNKNILHCNGIPLIGRAVRLAAETGCFKNILVSTESEVVLNTARRHGYVGDYLRPPQYATPGSPVEDAVAHALDYLQQNGKKTDCVMLLHPTSPCLTKETIQRAILHFRNVQAEMLISVSDANVPLGIIKPLTSSMKDFLTPKQQRSRTQDAGMRVKLNNAIVLGLWEIFERKKNYYQTDVVPFLVSKLEAIDIDDKEDFLMASALLAWRDRYERILEKPTTVYLPEMQFFDEVESREHPEVPDYAGHRANQQVQFALQNVSDRAKDTDSSTGLHGNESPASDSKRSQGL